MAEYKYELPELPNELRHAKTEREKAYLDHIRNLTEKIRRDFSTGLFHKEEFERQREKDSKGAYIFIDGDGLKKINDITQDHAAGDAAIKALAMGVQDALRARDNVTVARMGGDEFVVFVQDVPLSTGVVIARRILDSIRRQRIDYQGSDPRIKQILSKWPLQASIGVGRTREEADKAMYQAKQRGRNRVEFFKPTKVEMEPRLNIAEFAMKLKKTGEDYLSEVLLESLKES